MKTLSTREAVLQILLDADHPINFATIMKWFDQRKRRCEVGAALSKLYYSGHIERTGMMRHYEYAMTAETRARIADAGNLRLKRPIKKSINRVVSVGRTIASAMQPDWPAPRVPSDLAPAIGLPWSDEEELPPVIGERYADVMHRIGLE